MIINFKGFENTGIGIDVNKYPRQILPNNKFYITPPYVHLSLTTTLNNNNSPDKKNFREIQICAKLRNNVRIKSG